MARAAPSKSANAAIPLTTFRFIVFSQLFRSYWCDPLRTLDKSLDPQGISLWVTIPATIAEDFRKRKIGVLRSFCGPRDFEDKVALRYRLSITGDAELRENRAWNGNGVRRARMTLREPRIFGKSPQFTG